MLSSLPKLVEVRFEAPGIGDAQMLYAKAERHLYHHTRNGARCWAKSHFRKPNKAEQKTTTLAIISMILAQGLNDLNPNNVDRQLLCLWVQAISFSDHIPYKDKRQRSSLQGVHRVGEKVSFLLSRLARDNFLKIGLSLV